MKILLLSRGVPSARDPQWGSFELDQAKALKNAGHQVMIVSIDRRFRLYWRHIGTSMIIIDGIKCYNKFIIPGAFLTICGRRIKELFFKHLFDNIFNKIVKEYGVPDIIYSHYLLNIELGTFIRQKYNIPVVGIEHWSKVGQKDLNPHIKWMASRSYSNIDALVTVSSDLQALIKKNLGVDSYVVNNMLGSGFNYVARQEDKKEKLNFISTGNLLPIKGFNYLIEAFSRIDAPKDSWSLRILGGGKEKENLQEQIVKLGLPDNIKLLGRKQKEEVIQNLHESDVFIVSSLTETFGVAALEALACGLPVISTECGGPKDFITEENGIFCKVADSQSLADAIMYMMKNYQKYDCKKISETTNERFSQKRIAQQLTEIFENVLQKNKSK